MRRRELNCVWLRLAADERDEVLEFLFGHVRERRHAVAALHGLFADSRVGQALNRSIPKFRPNAAAQVGAMTGDAAQGRELLAADFGRAGE